MFLPNFSTRRPVFTTVMMMAILLVGWVGYRNLPVREIPDVEFPMVSVSTVLPGANPQVVETEVTEVLEEEINTVEGIKNLTSVSGENASQITAEFELDRNVDLALQDVRSKVSRIRGELPEDAEDPVIEKLDPDAWPIIWISVQAPGRRLTDVHDFAENVLKERLQTLEGVGTVMLSGARRFAVRIDLDASKMAAYGITVAEIRRALETGNVDLPSGRVVSRDREFTVRTEGQFETPEAFNELIVAWRNGAPIRLGDIGRAREGVENERTLARFNGEPTVGVGVVKQSDANTVAVAERVREAVEEVRASELPAGYSLIEAVNNAVFIERSVEEVAETLIIAFTLVVLVIMLFLQSGRATLIPAAAIPVSIIGTFGVFHLLGFSVNTLTLLALVLAIGIVVDDAIVVVENIYRHLEEGESRMEAARKGTSEIAFAVIAISLTLVIVFLPLAFISGIVGRLFREFGVGVAASVLISAFVALTLSPMLSSRFLELGHWSNRVFDAFERGLDRVGEIYERVLRWSLGRRGLVLAVAGGSLAASFLVMGVMGKEFVPQEDRGQFLMNITAPQGATLEYTDSYLEQVEEMVGRTEGVERYFSAIGLGFQGPPTVNSAMVFVNLAEERDRSQQEIMEELRRETSGLAGIEVFLIAPTSLNPAGFEQPLQFVLQAPDLDRLALYADSLASRASELPGLVGVDANLELNKPQLDVSVDRDRAASLGVSVSEVASTLQVLLGGQELSEFDRGSERYEVVAQLQDTLRATPGDLEQIYVRGDEGRLLQITNVVDVREGIGPNQIYHFDRRRSATVSASLQGIPLAEGLSQLTDLAEEILPAEFTTTVSGQSQDFEESFGSLLFALVMAVIAVYLVLAAQFESFLHPFTIMLALPLALVGAVAALAGLGMTLNIYSMIGIIMLMGLVTKNSILLVDFANQARRAGQERSEAIVQAGMIRLRPILMTSVSIIIGVMPVALALGAGAESRRPLGVAVVAGMVTSTVLTLLVVPSFYLILEDAVEWVSGGLRRVGRRLAPGTAGVLAAVGLGLGALTGVPAASGQEPGPATTSPGDTIRLTVAEAVGRAVSENEQVLMARAEEARTRGIVRETRAQSLPDVSTTFGYDRNIQSPVLFFNTAEGVQQISIGSANEYRFGLNLQQKLFDPSVGPARAAASLTREATAAQVEAARNDVARAARVAYFQVLLNRDLMEVQEAALEQAQARLEQVREFHRAGTGSEFDLLTAQVEVDNIRPELIQARNDLETARDELKRTIGLPLDRSVALTDSLRGPGEVPSRSEAVERALSRRADLRSQQTRISLHQENLTAEKNSALPTLSLNASLSRRASSEDLTPDAEDFSQSLAAGLAFSLPLFDGRAREGRVLQAEAEVQRERYRLQALRKQVRLEVEKARKSLEAARERIEASRSNVARAERALEIAQTRFQNGLSTQVELNDAELAVTRARTNYARALFSYNVSRADLRAAMGER